MKMRLLSTRRMPNEVAKHKNNANDLAEHKNKANRSLSKITIANEATKQENDGK